MNEAWYFIFTLGGRQPVQFGPYLDETSCLAAISVMQPLVTPSKPQECTFHHWKAVITPRFVQLVANPKDPEKLVGLQDNGTVLEASVKPGEYPPLVWTPIG